MTARKARGNVTVTYNSNAITAYLDSADLEATIDQLETTNLASTAAESTAGDPSWSISVSGMWDNAIDAILAPDAVTPGTKRTAVMVLTGSSAAVTYTWTTNAEIGDYSVSSAVGDFIKFSATLTLSGAPVRTSA
jgi:hypothetical protein